jgi:hypothetical protein
MKHSYIGTRCNGSNLLWCAEQPHAKETVPDRASELASGVLLRLELYSMLNFVRFPGTVLWLGIIILEQLRSAWSSSQFSWLSLFLARVALLMACFAARFSHSNSQTE